MFRLIAISVVILVAAGCGSTGLVNPGSGAGVSGAPGPGGMVSRPPLRTSGGEKAVLARSASATLTDPSILALITDDDFFSTADLTLVLTPASANASPTEHYGPYPSGSPDSGTCGTDWAQDTFNRHFTVRTSTDGTIVVVQQFKKGSFETIAAPSPGSCDDTDGSPPGPVHAGKTGSMHGYWIHTLPPGTTQTSHDSSCVAGAPNAPCTTAGFINSHFSCAYPTTCVVTTFFFHYAAGDQQLVEHEWKNASADRGGNHGDIRSPNGGVPE